MDRFEYNETIMVILYINNRMSTRKSNIHVQSSDMPEEQLERAIKCANESLNKFSTEIEMAGFIKKQFDKRYEQNWNVIVGR